jgi:hypothetical protein
VIGLGPAHAQTPPVNPQFGMVGLAAGETLRLNVVAFPPDPCIATIGFLNHDGGVPPSNSLQTVALQPGQADLVDLTAASLGIQPGGRREFQPVVSLAAGAQNACGASVELFNSATGVSQVAIPTPDSGTPNVAPQFGMIAIVPGQTLRLNVVAFPPNPCVATIGFLASDGSQAGGTSTVTLAPNHADFLDLPAVMLALQPGERAQLQPVVTLLAGPTGVSACQADAEVFDVRTGRTRVQLNPQPLPPRKIPQ